jgi:DNA-binding MarR family transcriptional regulator
MTAPAATEATIAAVRARYPALSPLSALAFLALCAAPAAGRALAKKLGLAQSELFRAVSSLEEAGLVRAPPAPDDDALRRVLDLTASGRRLRAEIEHAQTKTPPV